jgi:hypothetical protein
MDSLYEPDGWRQMRVQTLGDPALQNPNPRFRGCYQ